jgi:hypothetical protein
MFEVKSRRKSVVEGRVIWGVNLCDERGRSVWHITTRAEGIVVAETFWLENGEFYEAVRLEEAVNELPITNIETGRRVVQMNQAPPSISSSPCPPAWTSARATSFPSMLWPPSLAEEP